MVLRVAREYDVGPNKKKVDTSTKTLGLVGSGSVWYKVWDRVGIR